MRLQIETRSTFFLPRSCLCDLTSAATPRFYLRVLLCHRKGPTSFVDLRTVDGVVCGSYKDAAVRLGYLENDEEWRACMEEAATYVKKVGQKVYVLTGKDDILLEEPPVQFCQSKRHIMKVLFLCAVARPRADWDGKIGLWPVVESYITQRNSVNRPAGVEELRSVSIRHFRKLLLSLLRAITYTF
ncbi:hypothetical protein L914_15948 [Phytophthora nicotianae]|uniref:Uncharacterized protein n=1 Tax=Phytophthora nicotianae TaxID=4792 RepID=W2MPU1_PHYNI|nr:hypothetical protein L914_15948 [Phytophthora nicotianae]